MQFIHSYTDAIWQSWHRDCYRINMSKSLRILAGGADIIIVLYLLSVKHTHF
jgi:hypothetical protein